MTALPATARSRSAAATEDAGAVLGAALRSGDVLVLEGPLGAGKTCLARGIVRGAGGDAAAVRSPTFLLHQPHRGTTITIHHIDLYRLGAGAAVDVLDLDDALCNGAAVIEWGSYADLRGLRAFTLTIGAVEGRPDERTLCLDTEAPADVALAWRALCADGAAR